MATIKIDDLLLVLQQMKFDGYDEVEITSFDEEDDIPASISLSGINDSVECDYDECDYDDLFDVSETEVQFHPEEYSTYIPHELYLITKSLDLAHQYFKADLEKSDLSAEERSESAQAFKTYEKLFNIYKKISE